MSQSPPKSGTLWTASNLLSVSRVLLMVPVVYFITSTVPHHRAWAVLAILVAVITDALDGYLARLLHQVSDLGKILDPLADKVCVGIVVVLLLFFGDIPLWYVMMVLARDILIFAGGAYLRKMTGTVPASNMAGKFAVNFVALTLTLALLDNPMFSEVYRFSFWLSVVVMVYSFLLYAQRFFSALRSEGKIQ